MISLVVDTCHYVDRNRSVLLICKQQNDRKKVYYSLKNTIKIVYNMM